MIRKGTVADLQDVYDMIVDLAKYEKAEEEVEITLEQLKQDGFGLHPVYDFFIAESESETVGMALFYFRYSTWKGKALYLEDLVVREKHRGEGYGKALLNAIVEEAHKTKCEQVRWQVLDWNEGAINFYKKIGAKLDDEWINCTLNAQQIKAFNF